MKNLLLPAFAAAALMLSGPAAADRPTEEPLLDVFSDVDPCTGQTHVVTVSGTFFRHVHGDQGHYRAIRTVTTSAGYVGRGTEVGIQHDRIVVINDMLTNRETGERMRAHFVFVASKSGDVRVERFILSCVRGA